MTRTNLPKNIKSAYICETCGENWYADDKEKPWEQHGLKIMRKKGLELKIGEVFDYNGNRKEEASNNNVYFGIIISSEPIYNNDEHRRQYSTIDFVYDTLYRLSGFLNICHYEPNNFHEGSVREYSEQEFKEVIAMLRKNPDFQNYRKRDFKGKPIVRGILKKKTTSK